MIWLLFGIDTIFRNKGVQNSMFIQFHVASAYISWNIFCFAI